MLPGEQGGCSETTATMAYMSAKQSQTDHHNHNRTKKNLCKIRLIEEYVNHTKREQKQKGRRRNTAVRYEAPLNSTLNTKLETHLVQANNPWHSWAAAKTSPFAVTRDMPTNAWCGGRTTQKDSSQINGCSRNIFSKYLHRGIVIFGS